MSANDIEFFDKLSYSAPYLFVGLCLIALFVIKIILGEEHSKKIFPRLAPIMCSCGFLLSFIHYSDTKALFAKIFTYSPFSQAASCFVLFTASVLVLIISLLKRYRALPSVLYIVIFGLILSIIVSLSANNFLMLFIGLEGYTLFVCFLLLVKRNDQEKRLSVARFLITSSVMAAVFLYGMSLYYSDFAGFMLADVKIDGHITSIIGMFLILSAILFKMAAVPFHSWAIDLYEKSSLAMVFFFDAVSKFFMMLILTNVCAILLHNGVFYHHAFFTVVSVLSMVVGCVMPLHQKNIKKFLAYMSVGHVGFALTVFATAKSQYSLRFAITYLISYIIPYVCFFSSIRALKNVAKIETFRDIQGGVHSFPMIAYSIVISLFAMAGFPPFIGFVAKIDIFKLLIVNKNWWLLVISCFYTLLCVVYTTKYSKFIFDKKQRGQETKEIHAKTTTAIISMSCLIISILAYPMIDNFLYKIIGAIK